MDSILNFPFGELWEREVLHTAKCDSFITIRISNDSVAPYIVHPCIIFPRYYSYFLESTKSRQQFFHLSPSIHTGTFVFVGREWMKTHLSDEARASFIAQRIFNPNIGR